MKRIFCVVFLVLTFSVSVGLSFVSLCADEGMWLFENPPKQQLKEKYGFDLSDEWLLHVRLSSVRFGRSGSASFVSPAGLIMTNHHVGASQLQMHSTPENDMLKNGFYAKNFDDEIPCKGLECIVLYKVDDVTARVTAFVKNHEQDAAKARSEIITKIEQEEADKSKLHCEVVSLFQGGKYHLYCYKKYTDIRLVWAPEQDIAAFGGDPDNYEYPRYCVDCSFFRAYENGKPAQTKYYLKWSTSGVKDNELVFVSGHPGTTNRAFTREHLEYQRDVFFPERLSRLYRREVIYSAFANRSLENSRRIANDLDAVRNYRKRAIGQLDGLQTPSLWNDKPQSIKQISKEDLDNLHLSHKNSDSSRIWFVEEPELGKGKFPPDVEIALACQFAASIYNDYCYFETGEAFNSQTFRIARQLVRLAQEKEKPNADRLREYRDGNLDSIKRGLLNDSPIYEDVEILKLTDSLTMLLESSGKRVESLYEIRQFKNQIFKIEKSHLRQFDGKNKLSEKVELLKSAVLVPVELAVISPKQLAERLVRGSKLRDVGERQKLIDGGLVAVNASDDPMIKFVLEVDQVARQLRKAYEESFESPLTAAYEKLAKERFEKLGTNVYPDATFTLRLSFGAVKGYDENGKYIEPVTNIAGMFERADLMKHKEPFNPPQSWLDKKNELDQKTGFNIVSTNDIIGGNSGSPLINAKKEVVGLVFDGNIYSLSNNFIYTETVSRCVSVHVDVILESLKKIYKAERLVKELTNE
ncbi:MAG: S46 family peptidase [Planctomycetaceae bacterium]|nr:S46 family peptidase [Planctomycetaceae bacterium]